jgi:hypothetical protein
MTTRKTETPVLPPGMAWLHNFADEHRISRNDAHGLWSRGMISGVKVGEGRRARIAIADVGKHDAYIQFIILPNFARCNDCPHDVKLPMIEEKK